jgi:hypothetical protein
MAVARYVRQRFSPLDEELGLLPGRYTPSLREAMTRWGSRMPFEEAAEEIQRTYRTRISESTTRRTTYENGRASEAVAQQAVEEIEATAPEPIAEPERMVISADGAFIALTNGEWREVKTVALGLFASQWNARKGQVEVHSSELTYFSRSYPVRAFERSALGELHTRGLEKAKEVVTVNDGAVWIQNFVDYHCPQAVRILDFSHAQSYLAKMGKAILGEETAAFKQWYDRVSHQLKHEPPQRLLPQLAWFGQQAQSDEQKAIVEQVMRYLSHRQEMIDYAHFRNRGYPIGSGSVESSHKHVVHKRLKGAGMRWAEHHLDPILALRNLQANDRWDEGWRQLTTYRQQQRWARRRPPEPKPIAPPLTLDSIPVAPLPADSASATDDAAPKGPWRPPADHPWRRNWWPSRN